MSSFINDDSDNVALAGTYPSMGISQNTFAPEELHSSGSRISTSANNVPFLGFPRLPAEIRESIIDFYLVGELGDGDRQKEIPHVEKHGRKCCRWDWPKELVICDKDQEADLPDIEQPEFVPALARTNKQIRGEVLIHMLKTTAKVSLVFHLFRKAKIVPWFIRFLSTFPNNEGFNAIRNLNFPHVYFPSKTEDGRSIGTNPHVDLMLKCPELRRVGMTFHLRALAWYHCVEGSYIPRTFPRTLDHFLDTFKLEPILGCNKLEGVYIAGIKSFQAVMVHGDDQLQTAREFGTWLRESFAEKTPSQRITVDLYPQYRIFRGWNNGVPV